jgi:hypothetical protein
MRRESLIFVALVGAVAVTGAAVFAGGSSSSTGLSKFSNKGTRTVLRGRTAYLLAQRGNARFYRTQSQMLGTCYGMTRSGKGVFRFCPSKPFPTATTPALAFPGVQLDKAHNATLFDFAGFAADGVAQVELLDPTGETMATAQVDKNVFTLNVTGKPLRHGAKAVFKDADGNTILTQQY